MPCSNLVLEFTGDIIYSAEVDQPEPVRYVKLPVQQLRRADAFRKPDF